MRPPDPAYLDEITGTAQKWIRRCNNRPAAGVPTRRADLRVVLASSADVRLGDDGLIRWKAAAGAFTAEPVVPPPAMEPAAPA
jgi:hypothetical protein